MSELTNIKNLEAIGPVITLIEDERGHLYGKGLKMVTARGKRRPSYLNFNQIRELVRRGYDVRASSYVGGADVTSAVLSRILAKTYHESLASLPVEDLKARLRSA